MGKMAKKTFLIEKIMLYYWGREVRRMSYEDIFNLLKQFGITTHKDQHIISFYDDDANDYMSGDIPINVFTEARRLFLKAPGRNITMKIDKKNVDVFVPHILYNEEEDHLGVKTKTSYSIRVAESGDKKSLIGTELKLVFDFSVNGYSVINELLNIDLASGTIYSAEYAVKDDGQLYPINGVFSPEFGNWGSMSPDFQIKVLEHPVFKTMIEEYYGKKYPIILETIKELKAHQDSIQDYQEDEEEEPTFSFRKLLDRYIKTHPKVGKTIDSIKLVLKKKDDKE